MRGQRGPGTCLRPSVQLWLDSVWLCPPCRKATTDWWGHVPAITIISNRILSVTRALVLCHTTPHSQPPEKPSIQDRLIYRTVRQWLSPNSFTSCVWLDSEHTLSQSTLLSLLPNPLILLHNSARWCAILPNYLVKRDTGIPLLTHDKCRNLPLQ